MHIVNDSHIRNAKFCVTYSVITLICPDPPSWSPWNTWTTCECDGYSGKQSRSRTCIDLFPGDGNEECFGKDHETQACELDCTGKAIDVYLHEPTMIKTGVIAVLFSLSTYRLKRSYVTTVSISSK